MSIPKISGREARELLDGTTPGPWELLTQDGDPDGIVEAIGPMGAEFPVGTSFYDGPILTGSTEDHRLLAAAPALAETVAWLYGREPDGHKHTWEDIPAWNVKGDPDYEGDTDVWVPRCGGRIAVDGVSGNLTVRQAVELARALLAAAEEARS